MASLFPGNQKSASGKGCGGLLLRRAFLMLRRALLSMAAIGLYLVAVQPANALPAFARQTGQSCVACHAGGQFPELTPYGRYFKLTGYSIGKRTIPFSVMAVGDMSAVKDNDDGQGGQVAEKNGQPIFDYGSVFVAGKIVDNVGLFAQFTYANYAYQNDTGSYQSHFGSDNFDLRYADHLDTASSDLIWGLTLNNNPSVQDPWNTAPAWAYPYVGPNTKLNPVAGLPYQTQLEGAQASQVGGLGAYLYWNRNLYAEVAGYVTAQNALSFLSLGNHPGDPYTPLNYTNGVSPYVRLAYTNAWDAHNIQAGFFSYYSQMYSLDPITNLPMYDLGTTNYRDTGVDFQYQYLLDPHTITAQVRYIHENIVDNTQQMLDGPSSLNTIMAKVSYVYQAKYGASMAVRAVTGSQDSRYLNAGSANSLPDTTMLIPEIFWMPVQNIRVGLQYNYFTKYMGASQNYDGNGRNAASNNTAFLYVWLAY